MRLRLEEASPYRPITGQEHGRLAVLVEFTLYWASLIFMRAMQLEVELPCAIVVLFGSNSNSLKNNPVFSPARGIL